MKSHLLVLVFHHMCLEQEVRFELSTTVLAAEGVIYGDPVLLVLADTHQL